MDSSNQDQTKLKSESGSTEEGTKMKLQIRTARVQKYITVDENVAIKEVSKHLFMNPELVYQTIADY